MRLSVLLVALSATACLVAPGGSPAEVRRPNVVLILADDLGYGELGCGQERIDMPCLDALAREWRRFT